MHISKDGLQRIDPLSPEVQKLYDIIIYIGGIDPYDKNEESKSFGVSKGLILPKARRHN